MISVSNIIVIGLIAAVLLIGIAWRFARPSSQFTKFWIERTGRRAARPASRRPNGDGREDGHASPRG